jgi:hypothetical protein
MVWTVLFKSLGQASFELARSVNRMISEHLVPASAQCGLAVDMVAAYAAQGGERFRPFCKSVLPALRTIIDSDLALVDFRDTATLAYVVIAHATAAHDAKALVAMITSWLARGPASLPDGLFPSVCDLMVASGAELDARSKAAVVDLVIDAVKRSREHADKARSVVLQFGTPAQQAAFDQAVAEPEQPALKQ